MVLDTSLLNTQQYKILIKGKVEQSKDSAPLHFGVVAIEKGAFLSSSTKVVNFTYISLGYIFDESLAILTGLQLIYNLLGFL